MKIDEIVLHNLLQTYSTPNKTKAETIEKDKHTISRQYIDKESKIIDSMTLAKYDQNGQITISQEKKQALIDFFQ